MRQCWASNLAERPLFPEVSARLQAVQAEAGPAVQGERGRTVRQRGEALAVHVLTRNPAFLDFAEEDGSAVLADSDT